MMSANATAGSGIADGGDDRVFVKKLSLPVNELYEEELHKMDVFREAEVDWSITHICGDACLYMM